MARVHLVCAEMNAVWRPTSTTDLGIDGQIEFLEPGAAVSTGHLVAVQVKSGPSYFVNRRGSEIEYYPTEKHRSYWTRLSLPVILVLHNPDDGLTIFTRAKPQLAVGGPIRISIQSLFEPSARESLIGVAKDDVSLVPSGQVLSDFHRATYSPSIDLEVTGVHFLLASVHPSMSFLELRMCRIATMIEAVSGDYGICTNSDTYEFILRCTMKLWSHQLTEPFVHDFDHWWYDLKMVPDIAVALTPKGVTVMEHLWTNIYQYVEPMRLGLNVISSADAARDIANRAQRASDELDASDRLGDVPR